MVVIEGVSEVYGTIGIKKIVEKIGGWKGGGCWWFGFLCVCRAGSKAVSRSGLSAVHIDAGRNHFRASQHLDDEDRR